MKKISILILGFIISTTVSQAAGDFIRFGGAYGMNNPYYCNPFMRRDVNTYMNPAPYTMPYPTSYNTYQDSWSNPYDSIMNNSIVDLFKRKKNDYKNSTINDSDIEYLLGKMENNKFGRTYSNTNIENRLDRLDSLVFGAIQAGDYKTRLNRLKHAFSAETTREYKTSLPKKRHIKERFSAGYPTSMPANGDYYSSLEQDFHSWE